MVGMRSAIQPVGIDQVGQAFAIALLLRLAVVCAGEPANVLANILGFAPANGHFATVEHEIGGANLGKLGFVNDGEISVYRLEELI